MRIPRASAKLTEDFDWRLERKEEALSAAAPGVLPASKVCISPRGPLLLSNLFFKEKIYFYLCVSLCVCTHMGSQCPQRPKEGVGFRGAGVTGGCEPLMETLRTRLRPRHEWHTVMTAEHLSDPTLVLASFRCDGHIS